MKKFIILTILLIPGLLTARFRGKGGKGGSGILDAGEDYRAHITVGDVWNDIGNYGYLGGDFNSGYYGFDWPGGAAHNYYLWGSYLTIGAKVGGFPYVTYHNYPTGEWSASDEPVFEGPKKSAQDVIVYIQDFKDDNPRNGAGRHLGLKVIIHTLAWPHFPFKDFIAHEIYITYDESQCDISGAGSTLDSVFLGMWYDCDVSGADQTDPHIDDLVSFDGWTNGEWDDPSFRFPSPSDEVTLLPDSFVEGSDGVPDQYFIWGDEPDEHIVDSADAWDINWTSPDGDTVIHGYLIPRGMSYIYDSDNPADPGDDTGEDGKSPGYIGGAFIYAPPSPSDSIWIGPSGDTCRIIRPYSHQWWNWESDPATDEDVWNYLTGHHPATHNYRYAPHPYDLGASEFDYRFMNSIGPFQLHSGCLLYTSPSPRD